jgi:hypothetical protein
MLIRVTEKHIKQGLAHSANMCPVALAIKDVIKNKPISVGLTSIHYIGDVRSSIPRNAYARLGVITCELGYDVADKIIKFDTSKIMEPFEFELKYDE